MKPSEKRAKATKAAQRPPRRPTDPPYRLVVEGGGNDRSEQQRLREGMAGLLSKLSLKRNPRIVCSGSRNEAYKDFCHARRDGSDTLLLVDSEAEMPFPGSPWAHVKAQDGWEKPKPPQDDDLHFMAPTTEAWLAADASALEDHYGEGFKAGKLPKRANLEEEPKRSLVAKLTSATKATLKGGYSKSHAFDLVGKIDPSKVRERCPTYAERFFKTLELR